MNAQEALEFLSEIKEYKPIVRVIVEGIKEYGPEIYDLLETITNGSVDLRANAIRRFQEVHGFTKEESMILTMNMWENMMKNVNTASSNAKNKK